MKIPAVRILALLQIALLGLAPRVFGAAQATVSFDTGTKRLYADRARTDALSAGSAVEGDGCVIELGFYSGATETNPFAGSWVALTGESGMNAAFDRTSIGDTTANGAGPGIVAVSQTFVIGSSTSGNSLPPVGTRLALRFYNARSVATSTAFNAVSAGNWRWREPQEAPANPALALSLDDPNLQWLGGPESSFIASQSTGTPPAAPPLVGAYEAMISAGEWDPGRAGILTLNLLDSRGNFSATISSAGKRYRFRGVLGPDGQWEGRTALPGAPTLQVKIALHGGQLDGTVTFSDAAISQISGSHLANGQALKGSYTLLLLPEASAPAEGPAAPGFASMKINDAGVARITGTLPDGTPFSTGARLLADNRLLIDLSLRRGKVRVLGELVFRDQAGISDADGVWHWSAVAGHVDSDRVLRMIASKYDVSAPLPDMDNSRRAQVEPSLQLTLSGSAFESPVTGSVTLADDNRLSVVDPGENQVSISLRASSGIFRGSFKNPAGRRLNFSGVLFPKQELGAGLFVDGGGTGEVELRMVGD